MLCLHDFLDASENVLNFQFSHYRYVNVPITAEILLFED